MHILSPLLAAVLVLTTLATGVPVEDAAQDTTEVRVEGITYDGQPPVRASNPRLHIWQSDSHTFSVNLQSNEPVQDAELCLLVNQTGEAPRELGCQMMSLVDGVDRELSLSLDAWPSDLTGPRTLAAVVRNRTSGDRIGSAVESVVVLQREGDVDGDGLVNDRESELGTDIYASDTDGDGLDDRSEVRTYDTSPTDADTDADGLPDSTEVQVHHTDPSVADTDGDGLADGREVDVGTVPTRQDTDGDGLTDSAELDRYQTNAARADTDSDGLDDAAEVREYGTDPRKVDTDDDGLVDGAEVTVHGTDPARADTDGDGLPDHAEVVDHLTDPADADTDGDGLSDGDEVNSYGSDPLTEDTDGDGRSDGREVTLGSDPTDPSSKADPGPVRRAVWTVSDRPVTAGLVAGLGLLVVVVVLTHRYTDRLDLGRVASTLPVPGTADPGGQVFGGGAAGAEDSEESADESVDRPADAGRSPGGTATLEAAGTTASDDTLSGTGSPDLEVMTNEERVSYLLDEHDGRMLQSDIVDAADWSKATVSRVLSGMEEDGTVRRVDIGKGNLVTWPEDEPDSAESPFSER